MGGPDWKKEVERWMAGGDAGRPREQSIRDELAQHLEERYAELVAEGASPEEAARRTRAELGSVPGRRLLTTGLWQDVRHGVRALRLNHGFAITAVIILALGIGANTAVFSLVNAVLLRPLPFSRPEGLILVQSRHVDDTEHPFNLPDFLDFRDRSRTLAGIAAYTSWNAALTGSGEPERLSGLRVSADLFELLGVRPAAGRALRAEDDLPGNHRVVVLSHALWQRRFGGDPGVVGSRLVLNGNAYEVVGVLPPEFIIPVQEAELAVPLAPEADPSRNVRTSVNTLRAVARLAPGVTAEQAEADLDAIARRVRDENPVANLHKTGAAATPLREALVGDFHRALWVLLGSVGLVLLIASVNLAGLALTRASGRHKEMAVRAALGATPWRLARQLAVEGLMIALVGGAAGLLLAALGKDALLALGPAALPRRAEIALDVRVLLFTLLITLLAGLVFGMAPALQAARVSLNDELRGSRRGSSDGARARRARSLLVVSEVALSLVLLAGAGLLIRSFLNLQRVDPGFQTHDVLAVRLSLPKGRYPGPAPVAAFCDNLGERLARLPGVEAVGMVSALPLGGLKVSVPFTIEGRDAPPDQRQWTDYRMADAGYFRALRIPLLAGRGFDDRDSAGASPVAIISESFARRGWPDGDPVGARVTIDDNDTGPRPVEIVGVVGDVHHLGLDSEPPPHLYVPVRQAHPDVVGLLTNNQYWVLRTTVDPLGLAAAVRREIHSVDPDAPASSIRTLEQYFEASVAPRRFNLRLLTVFAVAALLLAGTGLYGVVSHGVAQRTHEMGLRMALGARPADVLRLVIRQGMALAAAGVALGLAAALALTRLMSSLLFGVEAADPRTLAISALLLLAVALSACWMPARRATRIPPDTALRGQ